jgi:multidrug efflux pump subunit AcrA (membrane-fusion protein)
VRSDLRNGTRVRAGDRLGTVDVLGVAVEVSAPVDGIVATSLVEDGDAVEYGQPLAALEPLAAGGSALSVGGASRSAGGAASPAGGRA